MAQNQTAVQPQQATAPAQVVQPQKSVGDIMRSPGVVAKIKDVLGNEKVAAGFISAVISVANGSKELRKADPMTVVGAAMVAATLQLPIVPTIGLAYIVPYKGQAQFQISYKGLIELAERSGQFKNIIDEIVYDGQLIKKNRFTGEYVFDEDAKKSDRVIGYMARFDLINGFSKTIFWTVEEVEAHAQKFSQAYRSGWNCPWKSDYHAMGRKTVLKALFSKYAPKSIQMQNAIAFDQASVRANDDIVNATSDPINIDAFEVEYIDNPEDAPQSHTADSEAMADAARKKSESKRKKVDAAMAQSDAAAGSSDQQAQPSVAEAVDPETGEVFPVTEDNTTSDNNPNK